ncbi:family 1 glycosylhydrolase [Sabulicella rubraurantiaca]|uniref:family 1 glycosylhydrolase n=1 Tax=Sabulicella rubraurantiaca TaxID=2811429 RepID=UPI001A965D5C|nr:family 1 glycosylhydrolase [Sabulicella rubraurantiaca]
MIRKVAYRKVILAGVAGAAVWEALARLLILFGLPVADIVGTLGAVAAPGVGVWVSWGAGLLLHFLVGAIWAIFYAYFFWSDLPIRPVLQGLLFAFIPMTLAILVVHPQFELMQLRGAEAAALPHFGFAGLPGRLHEPISIALGHLLWGVTLGWLYVRPVGAPTGGPPPRIGLAKGRKGAAHILASRGQARQESHERFMLATGIECSYPTIEGGSWRMDQMQACGHYRHWRTDLALVRELGLRYLRYGPPLHLVHRGADRYDWSFPDEVSAEMQRLGIVPIMDLCHFGLPDWLGNFQNPEVPRALADYARAFARRFPWVRLYTPVNEMYVCAKLSALDGLWNEQLRDERAFVTAVRHLAKANVLMMQAIAEERPDAVFVNSESGEFYQPCCPDPEIRRIAAFENERRFLPLDLLYARPVCEEMRAHLAVNGMPDEEYAWFMGQRVRDRAVLGVDYYDWNEKLIDSDRRVQALGELFGWYVVAEQYYERYRRPLMHTETNHLDAREAPRWLWRQWHNVQLMRQRNVPIVGFTWFSLTDQVDWDIGMREPLGNVNPVGLFDLNRDPRPVGQAYRHLAHLFDSELSRSAPLDTVLHEAAEACDA